MSIKKVIANGVIISMLTKYSGLIINLIISGVLARILNPEEFGIVGIAMVLITFFNLLGDFGISPAIVQNQDLSSKDNSSIFSFTMLIGLLLSIVFYFLSNTISIFYESVELINICKILSLLVFFNIIKIVPNALLLKKLEFKKIGLITLLCQVFSGLIGIVLAYSGYGYYSLIVKSLVFSFILFIILFFINPISLGSLNFKSFGKILKFSSYQFGFNFINYFSRNLDNILIGKFLGKSFLGYYEKSYSLMLLPVQNLTHVITPVLHPIFSSFSNKKSNIENNYFLICKILGFISFPLSIFLFSAAKELIFLIYGGQWGESVEVFQILALSIGVQMILSSSGSIFQSFNRTDLLFKSGLISAIVMVSLICLGVLYFGDLTSIGYCLLISFFINFFQTFYFLVSMVLKSSLYRFFKMFLNPIVSSFFLFVLYCILDYRFYFSSFFEIFFKFLLMLFFSLILMILDSETNIYFLKFLKINIKK